MKDETSQKTFLAGRAMLKFEEQLEDATAALSEYLFDSDQMGIYTPEIYENLGNSLSLLSQIASCAWGCRKSEHDIEAILRRFCNATLAALRLMNAGLYDEALGQARGMAEIANLLKLFSLDNSKLEEWKKLPSKEQGKKFSPVKVRLAIEKHKQTPVVNEDVYSKLCEIGIHVSTPSIYQSQNFLHTLQLGGHYSIRGVMLVLNTLAQIIAPCLIFAGYLVQANEEKMQKLIKSKEETEAVIRDVNVCNYESVSQKTEARVIRDVFNKFVHENLQELNEYGSIIYHNLIEKGEIIVGKTDEEEIKNKILDGVGNTYLERIRQRMREDDSMWVENAMKFAIEKKYKAIAEAYNQLQQNKASDEKAKLNNM